MSIETDFKNINKNENKTHSIKSIDHENDDQESIEIENNINSCSNNQIEEFHNNTSTVNNTLNLITQKQDYIDAIMKIQEDFIKINCQVTTFDNYMFLMTQNRKDSLSSIKENIKELKD